MFRLKVPRGEENVRSKVLSGILALAILGSLGMLVYTIASPPRERLTEFYLLGLSGEAGDYPAQLAVGEEGKVMASIINREQVITTYRLEVRIDGTVINELGPLTLDRDSKWKETIGFTPQKAGDNQKVEFLLYKDEQSDVYQKLYLWLDVR